ncbi:hypothetical protein QUC32_23075 [Novosphingobium resinovorum]|uniref:hypothetical protein n=1 Tax=Novosphingobium TaxID=165696 RepID=UPI001B3CA32D|nr:MULTISPECIES: hypothetical protein [Novosphingobium]MBF7012534.1 hypothetical protein [Novosphingobium sp. HR1a]WJM27268.1 hypothetical protein QUC32_23075 [Novosphingobium resinovorum]
MNKTEAPKPVVIRNEYLDGGDPTMKAARSGRSSLKIAPGTTRAVAAPAPAAGPIASRPTAQATLNSIMGGQTGMDGMATAFGKIKKAKAAG